MRTKARKLIWSAPLVAVFAAVGALAIFVALQPNPAAAQDITATGKDLPGKVQNLKAEPHVEAEGGIPQEQLKVSWDPPVHGGAVVSYRIDLSLDGLEWYSYITDHGDSDLRVIYGDETDADANEAPLLADTARHFRVFAFNQEGTGPGVSDSGTTSASWKPDPATTLVAMQGVATDDDDVCAPQTEIDLTWTAPEDPPGAPVTAYRIEWSPNGARWFLLAASVAADEMYTDSGLLADTTKHYRVYAINSVGRSLVSEESAVATTDVSEVPELPTAIEYILLSPDSTDVHIRWAEPEDPCGDRVSDYQIQARLADIGGTADTGDPDGTPDTDGTDVDTTGDGTEDTDPADVWRNLHTGTYTDRDRLNGLYVFGGDDLSLAKITFSAGTPVNIRIRTINRTGEAGSDTPVPAVTDDWLVISHVPIGDSQVPRRQRNPRVEQDDSQNQGRTGLKVSWPAATFNGDKSPADEDPSSNHDADVRYVLVIDEEEETDAASQRIGTGNDTDADAEVTGVDRGHVGLDASRQSTNDDALHAEDTRSYQVYPIRALADLVPTNFAFDITGEGVADEVPDTIRGLPSGVVSGSTARPLPPGVPMTLAATAGGHTEIDLSWGTPEEVPDNACSATGTTGNVRLGMAAQADAPAAETEDDGSECGMSVLTGYRVDISETGTSGWTTLATVGADPDDDVVIRTQHTATGLTPAKRYYFRVAALNSRGAGDNTNHVSTDTDTADMPTPPGGLVAQAVSTSALTMCWYEHNLVNPLTGDAILDEGLPVLGYQITYLGDDDAEVMLESHTMSSNTVFDDPSTLPAGTSRTYRVRSITLGNVLLVGGNDITLGGTQYSEAEANTLLAAPSGLTATADSDTAITLTWDAGGDAIHGYEVERKSGDGDFMPVDPAHSGTDAMYEDTGLTRGTEYTYRVRSVMSTVPSTWSDEKSAATHDVPGMPVVSAAATSDTEITVSWTAADNGSAITGYMVERGTMGADNAMSWMAVDPAHAMDMGMMYMDTGLMEMTKYYYRVRAMNAVDDGDWSDGMAYAMTDRTNVAPMAGDDIADQMVTAGMTVMVQSTITDADPEDGMLSWDPSSSDDMIATASADNMGMVTVTGVAAGDATITVTATDGMGESAMQTIDVTVEAANTAPMAGAAISDQTVTAGMTVMVQSTITDSDTGDMLTWSASSSDDMIATAEADDMGMVTVTGVAAGDATITVTATDGMGESAMQTIDVTVEAADTSLQDIPDSSISVTNNANSAITVRWMGGDNADAFIVVAAELGSDPFTYQSANVAGDAAKMTTITGLNSGSSYIIIVIALQGTSFEYGVLPSVTAN